MKFFKHNEVCKLVGLHKRTIQKYQEAGILKKPIDKDGYGHFKYTESDIENLWELKFYHELGYTIPQIKELKKHMNDDTFDMGKHFQQIEDSLKKKIQELERLIPIVENMKITGNNFNTLHERNRLFLGNITFEDTVFTLSACSDIINDPENLYDIVDESILNENLFDIVWDLFKSLLSDCNNGIDFTKKQVQIKIFNLHKELEYICSNSILLYQMLLHTFIPGDKYEKALGKERLDYLKKSIIHYYVSNIDNEYDNSFFETFNQIEYLYCNGFKANSPDVQKNIAYIYNFFTQCKIFKKEGFFTLYKIIISSYKNNCSNDEYILSLSEFLLASWKIYYHNNFIKKEESSDEESYCREMG